MREKILEDTAANYLAQQAYSNIFASVRFARLVPLQTKLFTMYKKMFALLYSKYDSISKVNVKII